MKNIFKIFGIVFMVMIIGFVCIACDTGGGGGGGGGDGNDPDDLILPEGYAWTDFFTYGAGNSDGIIFTSDGTLYSIDNYDGPWELFDTTSYTIDGDHIEADGQTFPWSVDGDTLEMFGYEWKKTQVGDIEGVHGFVADPVPAVLQGEWGNNEDYGVTFTGTTLILEDVSGGSAYTFGELTCTEYTWSELYEYWDVNQQDREYYQEFETDYPSVYLFSGVVIASNGDDFKVGNPLEEDIMIVCMNSAKDEILLIIDDEFNLSKL